MMYSGDQGIYTYTFELAKKDECSVCGSAVASIDVDATSTTVQDLIDLLLERREL
jgi:ubiquitin-activating enzyme E1 C